MAEEWIFSLMKSLIGLLKRVFYKTIGNGVLILEELEEVVSEVEVSLNIGRCVNYTGCPKKKKRSPTSKNGC